MILDKLPPVCLEILQYQLVYTGWYDDQVCWCNPSLPYELIHVLRVNGLVASSVMMRAASQLVAGRRVTLELYHGSLPFKTILSLQ